MVKRGNVTALLSLEIIDLFPLMGCFDPFLETVVEILPFIYTSELQKLNFI